MVRHIVMWKFKDTADGREKRENIAIARDRLYSLTGIIDEIRKMEIGIDMMRTEASMDLVLITEFDTIDALRYYAVHPDHLKVADFMKKVVETRVVLDYDM